MNKIRTPAKKYHFMIGTTSRVPGAPGWHYLIIDKDSRLKPLFITHKEEFYKVPIIYQQTQSGWHIYTPKKYRLRTMLKMACKFGADQTWARLALERGWAFLADKGEVKIPWPVERKIIGWRHTKNRNSITSQHQTGS